MDISYRLCQHIKYYVFYSISAIWIITLHGWNRKAKQQ